LEQNLQRGFAMNGGAIIMPESTCQEECTTLPDPSLLSQGIAAIKAGDNSRGMQLLIACVRDEPNNELAWLWLAACFSEPERRRYCLEKALAINPNNERVRAALEELNAPPLTPTPPRPEEQPAAIPPAGPQEAAGAAPQPEEEPETALDTLVEAGFTPLVSPPPAPEEEALPPPRRLRQVPVSAPPADIPVIQRPAPRILVRPPVTESGRPLTRAERLRQDRARRMKAAITQPGTRTRRAPNLSKLLGAVVAVGLLGLVAYLFASSFFRNVPASWFVAPTPLHQRQSVTPSPLPETTTAPSPTPAGTQALVVPSPEARPPLAAGAWMKLPVVPLVSDRARAIYELGLKMGNNPKAFSKVGDCDSTLPWYLGDFDEGTDQYHLGEYDELKEVIAQFAGSFGRESQATRNGMNSAAVMSPLWATPGTCQVNEAPLLCEYRLHRPSIAIIALGTNDGFEEKVFEMQMRIILDATIQRGIVPILATKADNLEGDNSNNALLARLAWEYQIPLWNFWLAAQSLPGGGLQYDGAHLAPGPSFYDDPANLQLAWPVRNLTALQSLDAVWRAANDLPPAQPSATPTVEDTQEP